MRLHLSSVLENPSAQMMLSYMAQRSERLLHSVNKRKQYGVPFLALVCAATIFRRMKPVSEPTSNPHVSLLTTQNETQANSIAKLKQMVQLYTVLLPKRSSENQQLQCQAQLLKQIVMVVITLVSKPELLKKFKTNVKIITDEQRKFLDAQELFEQKHTQLKEKANELKQLLEERTKNE